jgi:threonine/homoserine/homoserine lactone efflux protein
MRPASPARTPTDAVPPLAGLGLFVAAALLLLITPGPAVLYIVTRSMDQGRRAGLVSMLGVHAGTLVHIAAAAAGLSALLMASATAFSVVKYLGAGYLIYLGVRRLRDRSTLAAARPPAVRLRRAFVDGFVVNLLNPKTGLFFLAFLPQFADVGRGRVGVQILVLGLIFVGLGLVTDGLYALGAGTAARWLRASPRFLASERWVSGGMYIGLGVAAAFAGTQRK